MLRCAIRIVAIALCVFTLRGTSTGALVYAVPHKVAVSESGGQPPFNFGLVYPENTPPKTSARVDEINSGDDCDRERHSHHWAEKEWTWLLSCEADEHFIIHTYYTGQSDGWATGNVDDFLDCDFASSLNYYRIRNFDNGEAYHTDTQLVEISNPLMSDPENENQTLQKQSGTAVSGCVGDGTARTCMTNIESLAYIKSEAWARASQTEWTPGVVSLLFPCEP